MTRTANDPSPAAPLSGPEQRLLVALTGRRRAMLADLDALVRIPTGRSPHPAAVDGLERTRATIRARLEALGAAVELVPGDPRPAWLDGPVAAGFQPGRRGCDSSLPLPTLVCRKPSPSRPSVLLSGHLDTVHDPAPDAPFRVLSVAPDGKTATGPGVVDMKGGLVVALHALEALADVGLDTPFGFILNSDEETGSFCSDRALRAEASRREYAAALALEPASGSTGLVTSRGGSGQCMIEARGKAAHVGRDFASGRSATDLLARAILAAHGLTDTGAGSIVNFSTLWCDQPPNQVADHAAAWGNLRYATVEAGGALAEGLSAALAALSPTDFTLHLSLIRPAKPLTPETSALAGTVRATAAMLGQHITFTSTAGVCDGNNLQAGGTAVPTVEGGYSVRPAFNPGGARPACPAMGGGRLARPGSRTEPAPADPPARTTPLPVLDTLGVRGGGLHTPQEWIDLDSLVERAQLLALLIHRLTA